jgi:Ca2+-dependent lipid-binding protein
MRNTEIWGEMDPFIRITYKGQIYQTKVLDEAGKTPVWNESFIIELDHLDDVLHIVCYDEDVITNDFVGETSLKASQICDEHPGITKSEWFDLFYKGKKSGELLLEGQLIMIANLNQMPL